MSTKTNPPPSGTVMQRPAQTLDWHRPTDRWGLETFVPQVKSQLVKAMPHVLKGQADRMIRCLFTNLQTSPRLMDCAPISLFGGLIQAAQLGLELGGPLGQAYLIPYGKSATFVLGYKGALALAYRSTMLRSMPVKRVLEGDRFEVIEGTERKIVHVPAKRAGAARVTDYYVLAYLTNGGTDFESFSHEEAVEFRDRYASSRTAPAAARDRSPWYDVRAGLGYNGFDWMACKTLIKRIGKRLPLSVEFQTAIELDDMADREESQGLENLVEAARAATPESDIKARLESAKTQPLAPAPTEPERMRQPGEDDLYAGDEPPDDMM